MESFVSERKDLELNVLQSLNSLCATSVDIC